MQSYVTCKSILICYPLSKKEESEGRQQEGERERSYPLIQPTEPTVGHWQGAKPGTICVSHMGDRDLVTWSITTVTWGLHKQEAGVMGQSWMPNLGTPSWDAPILNIVLRVRPNACPYLLMFSESFDIYRYGNTL